MKELFEQIDHMPLDVQVSLLFMITGLLVGIAVLLYGWRDAFINIISGLFKAKPNSVFKDKRYGK